MYQNMATYCESAKGLGRRLNRCRLQPWWRESGAGPLCRLGRGWGLLHLGSDLLSCRAALASSCLAVSEFPIFFLRMRADGPGEMTRQRPRSPAQPTPESDKSVIYRQSPGILNRLSSFSRLLTGETMHSFPLPCQNAVIIPGQWHLSIIEEL